MADKMQIVIEVDAASGIATLDGVEKKLKDVDDTGRNTFQSLKEAATAAGISAVLIGSIEAATKFQNSLNGLASVARYAGQDVSATLAQATAITTDGLLSTTEAATALKNLLSKGFTTQQAVDMITRFKDAAAFGRQGSLELGEAVVTATEGIKNGTSALVDNAGVTKNISVMEKEYAASIGKTVGALSEAERRQAQYAGIMRETEAQQGNAALAADGLTGSMARMHKVTNDAAVQLGAALTPVANEIIPAVTSGISFMIENGLKPFIFSANAIGITIGEMAAKVGLAFDFISTPSRLFKPEEREKFKKEYDELGKIAEQSMIDAAKRMETPVEAMMGKDSGARRKDVEDKPDEKAAKAAKVAQDKIEAEIDRERDKYERMHQMAMEADATEEERVNLQTEWKLAQLEKDKERAIEHKSWNDELEALNNQAKIDAEHERVAKMSAIREKEWSDEQKRKLAHQQALEKQQNYFGVSSLKFEQMTGTEKLGIVSNSLAQITASGARNNKELFEINKAAGVANAIISTQAGAAKALELGWPLGPIMAGVIYAAGAANIANIASTEFGGGGSSGGGAPGGGAIPSQANYTGAPVQEVAPPTQGVAAAEKREVNIYLPNATSPADLYSAETVRNHIIPAINEAAGDGVAINVR